MTVDLMENIMIEIDSHFDQIVKIEKFVEEVCSDYNVSDDCFGNILIAITEAVNNSIQHGNKFDKSKKINVQFIPTQGAFVFSISDEGDGFDFHNVPDPTSPENVEKPNGRGVFLMKHLADQVAFFENGKKVELTFKNIML